MDASSQWGCWLVPISIFSLLWLLNHLLFILHIIFHHVSCADIRMHFNLIYNMFYILFKKLFHVSDSPKFCHFTYDIVQIISFLFLTLFCGYRCTFVEVQVEYPLYKMLGTRTVLIFCCFFFFLSICIYTSLNICIYISLNMKFIYILYMPYTCQR